MQAEGYGPDPAGARSLNAWAVVALVTGILALVPVAAVAGIVALVQVRRRGQRGMGLAIAGLAAAGVWTLLVGAALIALVMGGPGGQSGDLGRVADAGSTATGSCLAEPTGGSLRRPVDCAASHSAEVYRSADLGLGGTWPGDDRVGSRADDLCFQAFADYVGNSYDNSDYEYGWFAPDEAEWGAGEHRVICAVLPGSDSTMKGTVKGNGGL